VCPPGFERCFGFTTTQTTTATTTATTAQAVQSVQVVFEASSCEILLQSVSGDGNSSVFAAMIEFATDLAHSVALAVPTASDVTVDAADLSCVNNVSSGLGGIVAVVSAAVGGPNSGNLAGVLAQAIADGAIYAVAGGVNHTATSVLPFYKSFVLDVDGPPTTTTPTPNRARRSTVLTDAQRQGLANVLLARIATDLGVEPSLLGNATLLGQGPYRLEFTYYVDTVVALVASQQFNTQLSSKVITVVYEGEVYTANPRAVTTTTIVPTVQGGAHALEHHLSRSFFNFAHRFVGGAHP